MGKKLKIVIGVVIGLVVLFIGVPIALSFLAPGTVLKANPDNITGVSQFYVLKDGSLYNIRFSLVHKDSAVVTSDAHVSFAARAASGQVLYNRDFDVKSQDFQTYQLILTGAPVVAYAWQLNATDLQPTLLRNTNSSLPVSSSSGGLSTAYLNVTLPNGRTFTTSTTYL